MRRPVSDRTGETTQLSLIAPLGVLAWARACDLAI
jgi:hypothetical protein